MSKLRLRACQHVPRPSDRLDRLPSPVWSRAAAPDLRRGPPGPEAGFGGDLRVAAAALKNGLARRSGLSLDYFRRAARPNELFFTYRPEDVPRIREAFLRRG